MPNGNEHKNPPPPPPPPANGPNRGWRTIRPMAAATSLRRAQYAARPVSAAPSAASIGGLIGALIGCCFCLHHLH